MDQPVWKFNVELCLYAWVLSGLRDPNWLIHLVTITQITFPHLTFEMVIGQLLVLLQFFSDCEALMSLSSKNIYFIMIQYCHYGWVEKKETESWNGKWKAEMESGKLEMVVITINAFTRLRPCSNTFHSIAILLCHRTWPAPSLRSIERSLFIS